jgi:nucleotide-binding universal stress UspA family protein
MAMAKYLLVANQTLGGQQLAAHLDERLAAGGCSFTLIVPVTDTEGSHQWDYPPVDRYIPDAHRIARALAQGRLEVELARLRRAGAEATGEVVDADPVQRVREVLAGERFDEVIVSTLPRRLSRWLLADLPHRVARSITLPMTQVVSDAGPSL